MKATRLLRTPLALVIGIGSLFNLSNAFTQTWTLTSAPTNAWSSVASSADGVKLIAAQTSGPIYISTNSGATWSSNNSPVGNWAAVASSADGTRLAAAANAGLTGLFYLSSNAGLSWSTNNAFTAGNNYANWISISSSPDGTRLAATAEDFENTVYVFASVNSGASCSVSVFGGGCIGCGLTSSRITASANGTRVWVSFNDSYHGGLDGGGFMEFSSNSGIDWSDLPNPNPEKSWSAIAAASAYITRIVASTHLNNDGLIYTSTNSGNAWTTNDSPVGNWSAVASSEDGNNLVAVSTDGLIATSTNAGASWISNNAPALNWKSVASSADGTKLVAASSQGIYISQPPPPALSVATSGGNLVLSWPSTALAFSLQQNSDLGTSNWTPVTDSAVFTNGQYQLIVSPTNAATFYRLTSP